MGVVVQEADLVRLKREAKSKNGFFVEPEAKLMFVVRIRGLNKVADGAIATVAARNILNNKQQYFVHDNFVKMVIVY